MSAYKLIYQHYEQALLNLGLRMLSNQQDAEDAVQTTFLKLYRGMRNFNFKSKFSTYLFRIMLNACFDILNKRKRVSEQSLDGIDRGCNPNIELRLQLEEAIHALPDRMRACFTLFAVQQMKQTEVAEVLAMNIGTVKATIFQAKAKLRAFLSNQPEIRR